MLLMLLLLLLMFCCYHFTSLPFHSSCTEHEHSAGAGNGAFQQAHGDGPLLPVQHPQGHQGSGGHVAGAGGGGRLHAQGKDPQSVDE